jgi:hypothetical protein
MALIRPEDGEPALNHSKTNSFEDFGRDTYGWMNVKENDWIS